jgi:hypothetical protein
MATAHQLFEIPREDLETLMLCLPGPPRQDADWFFDFCQANDWWRFERTAQGEILVRAPAGGENGYREVKTSSQTGYLG